MTRSLAKVLSTKPPKELLSFLDDPPLVGHETPENYYNLFGAIVMAAKPGDAIVWLHVKCVVDLSWDIQREQAVKTAIIELMQDEVILDLLKTTQEASASLESHVRRVFAPRTKQNNGRPTSSQGKKSRRS